MSTEINGPTYHLSCPLSARAADAAMVVPDSKPLHWIGVLFIFLGLTTMAVRVYANRCGTSPRWIAAIALVTIVACLTAWLVGDGPLYKELEVGPRGRGVLRSVDVRAAVNGRFLSLPCLSRDKMAVLQAVSYLRCMVFLFNC